MADGKDEMHAAASHYANAYGIPVFPIWPRTKKPATAHGFYDASTVAARVDEMWEANPGANIGGRMGSGIVCIDFDKDDGLGYDSTDWLAAWEHDHGRLPETARAVTGRGGVHLYYRVSKAVSASVNEDLHIDVRGEGAYAMMPPSVHPNGTAYYWDEDPDDVGITDADANVYALIKAVQPKTEATSTATSPETSKTIPKGGRNSTLYSQACSLRAKGYERDEIVALLQRVNANRCKPPLNDDEVRRIAASAATKPAGTSKSAAKRGSSKPRPHDVARELVEARGVRMLDDVPVITATTPPGFGWDALHGAIIHVRPEYLTHDRKEVCEYIRHMDDIAIEAAPPRYVSFSNGVLDIETGTMAESCPQGYVVPVTIPHDYTDDVGALDPGAVAAVEEMLDGIADGDKATRANIEEMMGEAIVRTSKKRGHWWWLLGEGANGKSTLLAAIETMVGRANVSALQPYQFATRHEPPVLVGKLVNISDDVAATTIGREACAVAKKVVTAEKISVNPKYEKPYSFHPFATLINACNDQPKLADTTDGVRRRLVIIPMTARFTPGDNAKTDMPEDVTTEDAARYMCILAVRAYRRLMANEYVPTPNPRADATTSAAMIMSDPISAYLDDTGASAPELVGRSSHAYHREFIWWCDNEMVPRDTRPGQKKFTARVLEAFPELTTENNGRDSNGNKCRIYVMRK